MGKVKECLVSPFKLALSGPLSGSLSVSFCHYLAPCGSLWLWLSVPSLSQSIWLALAHAGSLWFALALSGSLWVNPALTTS